MPCAASLIDFDAKGSHGTELNLHCKFRHVGKWTRFANACQKFEGFFRPPPPKKNWGAKQLILWRFSTRQNYAKCRKL